MIIGMTGSFGAGKGAVVAYLVNQKGFVHYSASGFISEEIVRRGIPVNRESMIAVGNDLRTIHGPSYIIDELYKRAVKAGEDSVIESLRAVAEVQKIKELGGIIIGIDANKDLRYKRSKSRNGVKDGVTYEEWLSQEKQESNNEDPTKQNIFRALRESDYVIQNNGTLQELHTKIEDIITTI